MLVYQRINQSIETSHKRTVTRLANPQECPDLINVQPSMRWTALHQAAFNGDAEVAAFLLEKGEDGEDESQDESSIGYFGHIYNIYDIIYIYYIYNIYLYI